jgi:hypothetical protein
MRAARAFLLLLGGCLFPDLGGLVATDAGGDGQVGDVVVDAPIVDAGPQCDPAKLFGTPALVPGISLVGAENPRLSIDETEIFFQLYDDAGTADLMHATRPTPLGGFGTPSPLTSLNSSADDWDPMLSADGVTIVFASDRTGTSQIYRATRPSVTGAFGAPSEVAAVTVPFDQDQPYVQGENAALWYQSNSTGNGDIYVAPSIGSDYGGGQLVTELATPSEEGFPVVNALATVIYFFRDDADGGTKSDIWTARRADASVPFGPAAPVTELNTDFDESPGWLSPDLCRLYFTSARSGNSELYVATRTP